MSTNYGFIEGLNVSYTMALLAPTLLSGFGSTILAFFGLDDSVDLTFEALKNIEL